MDVSPRLSPAPRSLPLALSIRVVLGGSFAQLGWLFVGLGLVFTRVFDAGGAIESAVRFAGDRETAQGVTSSWRETSMSVDDVPVFETSYELTVDGRRMQGVSYRTGSYLPPGESVTVEYLSSDPATSRIQGMRTTPFGLATAFVFLFPAIGAVFATLGMRRGLRARRLMSTGSLALGTLTSKRPTNVKVNDQTVYELTFEFEAPPGGTYEASTRTHRAYLLEDEPRERLVYDPRDPGDASLLDDLPCRPAIDARGDFVIEGSGQALRAALNVVIPGVTVVGNVVYALLSR